MLLLLLRNHDTEPTTVTPPGSAWAALSLDLTDEYGMTDSLGAAELGIDLEAVNNSIYPGDITAIQHQGATTLQVREGMDDNGRSRPVITVPPSAQTGKAQIGFFLAPAMGNMTMPDQVNMQLAFETPGSLDHLSLEFTAYKDRAVVVALPHVADWRALRATNHTDEIGDPEYF